MNAKPLLDFIAKLEANGNYNAVYGHANARTDLSQFTLAQISARQLAHGRKTGSSAFGRYQFLRKTLLSLVDSMKLSGTDHFTPELQDRLAQRLLEGRGFKRWAAGALSDSAFMDSLSREWASLPYRTGKSYYDGDGMNHALATRAQVKAVLEEVRQA